MRKHDCTAVWNPAQNKHYCGVCGLRSEPYAGIDLASGPDETAIVYTGESGVVSVENPYGDEWDTEEKQEMRFGKIDQVKFYESAVGPNEIHGDMTNEMIQEALEKCGITPEMDIYPRFEANFGAPKCDERIHHYELNMKKGMSYCKDCGLASKDDPIVTGQQPTCVIFDDLVRLDEIKSDEEFHQDFTKLEKRVMNHCKDAEMNAAIVGPYPDDTISVEQARRLCLPYGRQSMGENDDKITPAPDTQNLDWRELLLEQIRQGHLTVSQTFRKIHK